MARPTMILVLLLPLLVAGIHTMDQEAEDEPQIEQSGAEAVASSADATRARNLCAKCACGRPKRPPNHESGVEVGPAEMPWLVLVHVGEANITTGTLINDRYVLCAAAPLYGYRPLDVKVSLGADNMCIGDTSTLNISVVEVYLHPEYDLDLMTSDLSLLRLSSPVIFTSTISPVCLPPSAQVSYVGQVSMAASWAPSNGNEVGPSIAPGNAPGLVRATGKACRAHKQPLPVLQQRDCFLSNVSARYITQDKGCAGIVGATALACQRDAGGPVIFQTPRGSYHLIGVLATANECEYARGPSLYTHVAPYLQWIHTNTKDACGCSTQ